MRVILIGSGIAGLSAAIALRCVGIEVAVYERAPELTEVGAGITLWSNALRALDYIGAGAAVRAAAEPVTRTEFRTDEGRHIVTSIETAGVERRLEFSPLLTIIHRAELVTALCGCLPEGVARYGFECTGVEQQGDRAAVVFRNGHRDEADVVIGADGIRSVVRASLLGAQEPRYAGYTGWRGICSRPASLPVGYTAEWWGKGQRAGITTLPGDRVYWWASRNEPPGECAGDEQAFVRERFRSWADPLPELIATTPPDRVLRNDIMDRPPIPDWSRGRIGLIGDAAHSTTPNFGQGGCQAIEDAVALARCLQKGTADPENALKHFQAERHARTSAITQESYQMGSIGQWEGRAACWFRDRLFGLALAASGPRALARHAAFDIGPLPGKSDLRTV